MDRAEYKAKIEDIRKLIDADKLDEAYDALLTENWKKVPNVNIMMQAGELFAACKKYEEARELLVLAHERSPIGRMIIYRLALVCVELGELDEASEYYDEFVEIAPHDSLKYIIRYQIAKAKGSDDLTLSFQMYSGRTGSKTTEKSFYSTGNNRFSNVLRRFRNAVLEQLTVKGKVIGRNGKRILVDLGLAENIKNGAELAIIRKGGVRTAEVGPGVIYKDEDAVGTVKITECGEEISEGIIENHGFYDRINIGDELVLISLPSSEENGSETPENVVDNVPAADAEGKPVRSDTSVKGQSTIAEIKRAVSKPSIIELLRNIY